MNPGFHDCCKHFGVVWHVTRQTIDSKEINWGWVCASSRKPNKQMRLEKFWWESKLDTAKELLGIMGSDQVIKQGGHFYCTCRKEARVILQLASEEFEFFCLRSVATSIRIIVVSVYWKRSACDTSFFSYSLDIFPLLFSCHLSPLILDPR